MPRWYLWAPHFTVLNRFSHLAYEISANTKLECCWLTKNWKKVFSSCISHTWKVVIMNNFSIFSVRQDEDGEYTGRYSYSTIAIDKENPANDYIGACPLQTVTVDCAVTFANFEHFNIEKIRSTLQTTRSTSNFARLSFTIRYLAGISTIRWRGRPDSWNRVCILHLFFSTK